MDFGYCLVEPLYWCLGLCRQRQPWGFPLKVNLGDKEKKRLKWKRKICPLPFENQNEAGLESGKDGKDMHLPGKQNSSLSGI